MDSRILFKNIFGKESNFTENDIEEKVIKISRRESVIFECKSLRNISKLNDINKDELILKPLIAFLNKSSTEGGVLILGVSAKDSIATEVIPIEDEVVKNEAQLRDWITTNVSSIPYFYTFPTIEIEKIMISKNQNIFAVEIHTVDTNVVYFSRLSDSIYKRVADKSEKINLLEATALIDAKRMPLVYITMEGIDFIEEGEIIESNFKIVNNNKGSKPAYHCISWYSFKLIDGSSEQIDIQSKVMIDATSRNTGYLKVFQTNPNIIPFFPGRPFVNDEIKIKFNKNSRIRIFIETNDEMSYSKQEFILSKDGIKEEASPIFKTYIS